jgi:CCR4-NOT transcription complex subunit 6
MGTQGGSGGGGVGKISEHWQQQLQMAQDSRQASSPHHYARANAHDNKGVTASQVSGQRSENEEERNRATNHYEIRRQDWMSLDLGGQGLRALSDSLFHYIFLDKLYLNSNKLTSLPSAIGRLKNLSHLDLSCNQLSELPPELGMLVNLKNLLIFDNNLHTLPHELGALYQLEMIGLEGNPLEESLKSEIMRKGTKALITHLREEAPGMRPLVLCLPGLSCRPA